MNQRKNPFAGGGLGGRGQHGGAKHGSQHDENQNDDENQNNPGDGSGSNNSGNLLAETFSIETRFNEFFDSRPVMLSMACLTVFVLWGDDLRLYAFPKDYDPVFYTFFLMAFLIFFFEFMGNTICKPGYKGGFFFWLDLIATFSLLIDIPWVLALIEKLIASSSGQSDDEESGAASINSTVATVRTARAVRLVRLIRLVRVVKLWSMVRKANESQTDEMLQQQQRNAQNAKQAALKRVEASRLGKLLSEMTTRRVVVMVLMMLFVLPFLDPADLDNSKVFGLSLLFWFGRSWCDTNPSGATSSGSSSSSSSAASSSDHYGCSEFQTENWLFLDGWRHLVFSYSQLSRDRYASTTADHLKLTEPLLWLRVPNWADGGKMSDIASVVTDKGSWYENAFCGRLFLVTNGDHCPHREDELEDVIYIPPNTEQMIIAVARFDRSEFSREQAAVSMLQTCFVCILLGTMSIQFQNDTQSLVIRPIEKMVNIIKQLAEDPLEPPNLDEDGEENGNGSASSMGGGGGGSGGGAGGNSGDGKKKKKKNKGPQLETTMLENTILKIGGLLQVGFGEAGAQIIGKNMSSGDGELNIMMPGSKVESIFGFVDIRQFTDTTECLEEDVMVFVNSIGYIVHKCVHRWSGVANKNIGDAFLVLWKIPDRNSFGSNGGSSGGLFGSHGSAGSSQLQVADIADRSLFAFLKIIAEAKRSERIKSFASHPRIIQKFGKNCEVCRFGLGLHVGWAIEGPIGSDYKIDASYLSPHVNITMSLEAWTKIYLVNLLLSEPLYLFLSLKAKQRCRKIDMVSISTDNASSNATVVLSTSTSGAGTSSSGTGGGAQDAGGEGGSGLAGSVTSLGAGGASAAPTRTAGALLSSSGSVLLASGGAGASHGAGSSSTNGKPFGLYTFPMDVTNCVATTPYQFLEQHRSPGDVWKPESLSENVNTDVIEMRDGVEFLFLIDKDVHLLQKNVPGFDPDLLQVNCSTQLEVKAKQRKALSYYLAGDWRLAREYYEDLLGNSNSQSGTTANKGKNNPDGGTSGKNTSSASQAGGGMMSDGDQNKQAPGVVDSENEDASDAISKSTLSNVTVSTAGTLGTTTTTTTAALNLNQNNKKDHDGVGPRTNSSRNKGEQPNNNAKTTTGTGVDTCAQVVYEYMKSFEFVSRWRPVHLASTWCHCVSAITVAFGMMR
ncbi:unnamed protein product [Amoebophrya sp. A120]|nr:unnamed protein product [Amoebophrya sp. A120]|eukprot:GSA120T00022160001.1